MPLRIRHCKLRDCTVKVPNGKIIPGEVRSRTGEVLRPANSPSFWTLHLDSEGCEIVGETVWQNMQTSGAASAFEVMNYVEKPPTQKLGIGVQYGSRDVHYMVGSEIVSKGPQPRTHLILPSTKLPHDHRS